MSIVLVPEGLREKLGAEAAKELVDLINASAKSSRDSVFELAAERFERRLVQELAGLESRLKNFVLAGLGLVVGFLTFVIAVATWLKG